MARAYSVDLRERAVDYVLSGGSRQEACAVFKIALSTLGLWLRQYRENDGDLRPKPKGSRPWKLDHEAIVSYVKDNNDSTLQEIADHFDTVASMIDYVLRKSGVTRKKTTLYVERDEEKRQSYLDEIKDIDPRKIIYIDESGVEDTLFRHYARAPRGEQVLADIRGHKTKRISLIAGLLGRKLIAPMMFEGYTDAAVFNQWLEECLLPETPPGHVIIMDGASFHKNKRTPELIEKAGCYLIYLPPYSPDFNPIEEWWAILKAKIKAILPCTDSLIQAIETAFQNMNYHKKKNEVK